MARSTALSLADSAAGEPAQISAKQELVENLINDHLVRV